MTSKSYTLLLGASTLCAWGSLGEIVKAFLRRQTVTGPILVVLGISAILAVGVWIFYHLRGICLEIRSFIGSIAQGAALLFVYVSAFVLPGFFTRGADLFDLVFTASVAGAVNWLVLYYLKKRYFTPPDTPAGL